MKKSAIILLLISAIACFSSCNRLVDKPYSVLSMIDPFFRVTSITPSNGTVDVVLVSSIQAVFNREVDSATVDDTTFIVSDGTGTAIDGTVVPDSTNTIFTFTPTLGLLNNTLYTISLTTLITDMGGSQLIEEADSSFITVIGPPPPIPTITPAPGTYQGAQSIAIQCTDSSATIMYTTDGSIPTGIPSPSGTQYLGPFMVSVNTPVINAIAFNTSGNSPLLSAAYTIQVIDPTFDLPAGNYGINTLVNISTSTPGATITYTINGPPPPPGIPYTGPIDLGVVAGPQTVRAIAQATNMLDSNVITVPYNIVILLVSAPSFSPPIGTYSSPQTVTLTTSTPGATIIYTTDGFNPTHIPFYGNVGNSVVVTNSTVLKAMAWKAGYTDSPVTNAAGISYIIKPRINSISPTSGSHNQFNINTTISGLRFQAGVTAKLQNPGDADIVAAPCTFVNSTTINATFFIHNKHRTWWDVVVTNPDGGTYTLVNSFRIR